MGAFFVTHSADRGRNQYLYLGIDSASITCDIPQSRKSFLRIQFPGYHPGHRSHSAPDPIPRSVIPSPILFIFCRGISSLAQVNRMMMVVVVGGGTWIPTNRPLMRVVNIQTRVHCREYDGNSRSLSFLLHPLNMVEEWKQIKIQLKFHSKVRVDRIPRNNENGINSNE